ncbi:WD domain-containing protein [Aaosphaeria arxii CBS 175.79]|uniref:Pre-rRNA-processing protein IPI3 n=1 Tax=Aaosphaeria arxii CBS 175.79 TaxID=1450172 RepID=A0A6A5Y9S4_9PLEO|nr:WD domain-containing protein [Aaosphaeria arxii CBS 175.79]KAF2022332.1 WD domain-containing protein [Aaosphaeria arxii CBS 175.79]
MLTEHFVAAIAAHTKPNTGVTKDAGIFYHEFQPLAAQRHIFKKSASAPNGLAVSSSHIFTAQADKALIHVYSRDKGNQEALIPFPEKIHSIALALEDTVLLLGTGSGRILAWEITSGRLVSTSTSHLQPVTSLIVDPTSNFFLSGSLDSMIHVWALPNILSFAPDSSRTPIHTLSTHRAAITSLACGHSHSTANIAVSISEDKSAIVWDYHTGQALRTYLLPEAPTAVTLDPADRAFFVAYEDGSLQTVSFYDELQQTTPVDILRDGSVSHQPIQPSSKSRFNAESQKLGGAVSVALSWDGQTLISGHASGKIASWDIAKGNYISTLGNLPGPVTNLQFLAPTGFPNAKEPKFKVHTVVKPRQDLGSLTNAAAVVPSNYSLNVQLTGRVDVPAVSATDEPRAGPSQFEEALAHPSFPLSMLEEGIAELEMWGSAPTSAAVAPAADFMSLSALPADAEEGTQDGAASASSQARIKDLEKQLASLQRIQKVTFEQLSTSRSQVDFLTRRERKRAAQKQFRANSNSKKGVANGKDANGDVEMSSGDDDGSSTPSGAESNDGESDGDDGAGASGKAS